MQDTSNKTIDTHSTEISSETLDSQATRFTESPNCQPTTYRIKASSGEDVKFYYSEDKSFKIRYNARDARDLATRDRIKRILEE